MIQHPVEFVRPQSAVGAAATHVVNQDQIVAPTKQLGERDHGAARARERVVLHLLGRALPPEAFEFFLRKASKTASP